MKLALIIFLIYISITIYVTIRINKSFYISEEMRKLHKKLIWILPFLGPLILKNFWRREKINKFPTNTKTQRDKNQKYGDFYESGKGMDF
jgi:hypothetical protein